MSYTLEAKITGQRLKHLASFATPALLAGVAEALQNDGGAAQAIAGGFAIAVGLLALGDRKEAKRWAELAEAISAVLR